ncbi:MAG: bifunctional heptose 7-phosphate kinase/heptose 1-phosphate adenyltransferase [Limisphaerales bacterium]
MDSARFNSIAECYSGLRIAVLGDFCLDRYLEIDPAKAEVSLETGLPVHNVINVRAQPGGAGTIVNNLAALGVGTILPVGFVGKDGEGVELRRALGERPGVRLNQLIQTDQRRTFTYCKPLVIARGKPPQELNRLDFKNWTPTPAPLQALLAKRLEAVAERVNAVIVLDQVDVPETGVVTLRVREAIKSVAERHPDLLILADSRRGLRDFPPVTFKMNVAELRALTGGGSELSLGQIKEAGAALARRNGRNVFVTLSERGILGAAASGQVEHVAALPVRGEIDIVGAGDAVTANLASALAAGASLGESLEIANAAASVVVHKLGTTGTASVPEIRTLLCLPEGA